MGTVGVIGCILAFLLVIYLCYRDWSVYIATFCGACVVMVFTQTNFVQALTTTYVNGIMVAIKGFFFMLMFGCIQSYLYRESGAAYSIANFVMNHLLKDNQSATKQNVISMSIILIIGTVLSLGGIIAGVVIVLMYPIALAVFERCDIPKRFILGMLGAGAYTFTLTLPGSPEVTNVAAMQVLHTASTVAAIPGICGAIVEILVILIVLNRLILRAKARGEHFQRHPLDPSYETDQNMPNFFLALIPLIVLFIAFNAFHADIIVSLLISCIASVILFRAYLPFDKCKKAICDGATDSIPMTLTVAAICGFAQIMTQSDGFKILLNTITGIQLPAIFICWFVIALMCMLTGGSSTGQLIALPLIAPKLIKMGLNIEIIHRVSVFAATTLDSMPYSGSILMLLPMCHMKLKEIYPPMFVTTVLATTCGTATVVFVCSVFPNLA